MEEYEADDPPKNAGAPFEARIQHAVRCWQAEEENSRRLSTRLSILTTATLGFFGIALFRVGAEGFSRPAAWDLYPAWLRVILLVLLVGGLLLLLTSLGLQMDAIRLRRHSEPASGLLRFPEPEASDLDEALYELATDIGDGWEYQHMANSLNVLAAARIEYGTENLAQRNAAERKRVYRAQKLLIAGFIPVILALGLSVYTGSPNPEGTDEERQERQTPTPAPAGAPDDHSESSKRHEVGADAAQRGPKGDKARP